jgi:hypothetical protein
VAAISEHLCPNDIAITLYYGMGCAEFMGLVGIQGSVNATEDDIGAAFACQFADLVSPERIGGVDANANDISSLNSSGIYGIESFVHQGRVTVSFRGGRC